MESRPGTWSRPAAGAFVSALMVAAVAACGGERSPGAPTGAAAALVAGESRSKAGKVDICHRSGNGRFHLINVSANAESSHVAHGDGHPGEAVPGNPAMRFDAACDQVAAGHSDVRLRS